VGCLARHCINGPNWGQSFLIDYQRACAKLQQARPWRPEPARCSADLKTLAGGDCGDGARSFGRHVLRPGATWWKCATHHTVLVRRDGFAYAGRPYRSLTVICRGIPKGHMVGPAVLWWSHDACTLVAGRPMNQQYSGCPRPACGSVRRQQWPPRLVCRRRVLERSASTIIRL